MRQGIIRIVFGSILLFLQLLSIIGNGKANTSFFWTGALIYDIFYLLGYFSVGICGALLLLFGIRAYKYQICRITLTESEKELTLSNAPKKVLYYLFEECENKKEAKKVLKYMIRQGTITQEQACALFSIFLSERIEKNSNVNVAKNSNIQEKSVDSAVLKCQKCGKHIPGDSDFCQYCGSAVVKRKPKSKKTLFIVLICIAAAAVIILLSYFLAEILYFLMYSN